MYYPEHKVFVSLIEMCSSITNARCFNRLSLRCLLSGNCSVYYYESLQVNSKDKQMNKRRKGDIRKLKTMFK